jgi:hypothetical protein
MMKLKERLERELASLPYFEEPFVYGMFTGIAVVLVFLMSMLGVLYAIHENQVHAVTLLWIDAMAIISYHYFGRFHVSKAKRLLLACCMATFVFEVHDNFWVTTTLFNLKELMLTDLKGIFIPTQDFYIAKYSRNLIMTLTSFLFVRKYLIFNKRTIALSSITIMYWVTVIYFGWTYILWYVMFFFSSLMLFAFVGDAV